MSETELFAIFSVIPRVMLCVAILSAFLQYNSCIDNIFFFVVRLHFVIVEGQSRKSITTKARQITLGDFFSLLYHRVFRFPILLSLWGDSCTRIRYWTDYYTTLILRFGDKDGWFYFEYFMYQFTEWTTLEIYNNFLKIWPHFWVS